MVQPVTQAQALQALANLDQVGQLADARVSQAASQTIASLQEALAASLESNRTLNERNLSLNNEVALLKKDKVELTQNLEQQKKAAADKELALRNKIHHLQTLASAQCDQLISEDEAAIVAMRNLDLRHLSPFRQRIYREETDKEIVAISKKLERTRNNRIQFTKEKL